MGKDCFGASCPLTPRVGGQVTSLTGPLTSILSTVELFPWVCVSYSGGRSVICGAGRQLCTSQVKRELKTKPQQTQHPMSFRDFP
jgi:hypothetical protein